MSFNISNTISKTSQCQLYCAINQKTMDGDYDPSTNECICLHRKTEEELENVEEEKKETDDELEEALKIASSKKNLAPKSTKGFGKKVRGNGLTVVVSSGGCSTCGI